MYVIFKKQKAPQTTKFPVSEIIRCLSFSDLFRLAEFSLAPPHIVVNGNSLFLWLIHKMGIAYTPPLTYPFASQRKVAALLPCRGCCK